jgi:hypothetical protein
MIKKLPEYYKDEYTNFLDTLQESNITNMWGAVPYLLEHTDLIEEKIAEKVLFYWMNNWKELHPT